MPTAGLGADQAALADGDADVAAAGQGAHGGGAPADVRAVADDDAGRDAALDHRGAEGARVEVHEALVHHGGALGEVRAEPDAVGVGDADALGRDVVRHARELVDGRHLEVQSLGTGVEPYLLDVVDGDRAERGPGDIGEVAEDAVQALAVGPYESVREQVQPQVRVVRVDRLLVQRGDDRADRDHFDAPAGVGPDGFGGAFTEQFDGTLGGQPLGVSGPGSVDSSGAGNQVSRTVPSAVRVARPAATAPVVRVAVVSVMGET